MRANRSKCPHPERVFLLLGVLLVGCAGRRVEAPRLDPQEVARLALAEYDQNRDGVLDAGELERCPAFKASLKTLDTNKDGKLTADEIAARVTLYQTSRVGLTSISCQVKLDGADLVGATVELVPEKFLGEAVQAARGVSGQQGSVTLRVEGQSRLGVHCGFYRVVVSKKDGAGKEMLPEKYNAKTVLGHEIGPDLEHGLRFDLTSQ